MKRTPTNWHLLIVTEGGTVSLLRNLTRVLAEKAVRRLTPYHFLPFEIKFPDGVPRSFCQYGDPGRISRLEVLGPEGQTLDPWSSVIAQQRYDAARRASPLG